MNRRLHRLATIGAVALGLAGCNGPCQRLEPINAPTFTSGSADFSVYAAIGTSVSAGSQSGGGLVIHHQVRSFPVLFSQQVGAAAFNVPTISPDGYQPLLRLISYSPLRISNAGRRFGLPLNRSLPTAYHHMAVPGAILLDVTNPGLYARDSVTRTRFDYIVRGRGTVLSEVASLNPTFVSFEMGANEVLGPGTQGSGTPVLDGVAFAGLLHQTLGALAVAAPRAKLAMVTVPDVTTLPFFTTFPRITLDTLGIPTPLIGVDGPLASAVLVLLTAGDSLAAGTGFPTSTRSYLTNVRGNGRPLPESMLLRTAEVTSLRASVNDYNAAIKSEATARGAAVIDLHGLLQRAATTGIDFRGAHYDNGFLTGGLFSLDAIHPTDFAHALICNTMIEAVNAKFGSTIPRVDPGTVGTNSASLARRVGARKPMPWILNSEAVYRETLPPRSLATP